MERVENIENQSSSEKETLERTLSKIIGHMKNDKKFNRASLIFINLLNAELSETTAAMFYESICSFMSECDRDVTDTKFSNYYMDIFQVILDKIDMFTEKQKYRLYTFSLYARIRNMLQTDDSYRFVKICQEIKKCITNENSYKISFEIYSIDVTENQSTQEVNEIPGDKKYNITESADITTTITTTTSAIPTTTNTTNTTTNSTTSRDIHQFTNNETNVHTNTEENELLLERQKVLILVLETACRNYTWLWARQPIEELIQLLSERRLLLQDEEIRHCLDEITEKVTLMKRKNIAWTGIKRVTTSENTHVHPLFVKKYDTII